MMILKLIERIRVVDIFYNIIIVGTQYDILTR